MSDDEIRAVDYNSYQEGRCVRRWGVHELFILSRSHIVPYGCINSSGSISNLALNIVLGILGSDGLKEEKGASTYNRLDDI